MSEPKWLTIARSFLGIHEGTSLHANPQVLKFFAGAGFAGIKNDHDTPWCAAFVGAVLHQAGIQNPKTLWALNYASWGKKLKGPAIGAIATKSRNGGGHVFFVVGWNDKAIFGLGGNQGDKVSIAAFSRGDITGFNWPATVPLPDLNAPHPTSIAGAAKAVSEA